MRCKEMGVAGALATILTGLVACGGGTGATATPSEVSRDPVASSPDNPGTTRDDPGSTRDDPGSTSAGSPSCVVCGGTYNCTGTILGQAYSKELTSTTKDGQCVASETIIACGGTIASPENGQSIGSWKIDAQGTITLTLPGLGILTCTPEATAGTVNLTPTQG